MEPTDITSTPVIFGHARAYEEGYVLELIDSQANTSQRFAIQWASLNQHMRWTSHDLVEFFFQRQLPRIIEIVGDRDLVLYFDCLRIECAHPHLMTKHSLTEAGLWQ